MKVLLILFACVFGVFAEKYDNNLELPPSIVPCRLKNAQLNECIKDSINIFVPSMRQKIPNIDLPSLEPITYKLIGFTYKNLGSFSVKDFKGHGISRAKVQNVRTKFNDNQVLFSSDFAVPKILLLGNYKGSFAFNNFKLSPKGQFNITLKSVSGKLQVQGMSKNFEGEDYLKLQKLEVFPEVKEMKFSISGIFPDPNMNQFINEFVNQNWRDFYNQTMPEIKRQLEPILVDIVDKLFTQIPLRRLLIQD